MQPWINLANFDPDVHHGFVYLITNLVNQRKYIGRKYSWTFDHNIRIPSNWENYWGSSPSLHKDIRRYGKDSFERVILIACDSRQKTDATEVAVLLALDVLHEILPDGTREFYNQVIRQPWPHRFAQVRGDGYKDFWQDFWEDDT